MQMWLREQGLHPNLLEQATFYSDSSNDLPLLKAVGHPIVVDPDPRLRVTAESFAWPIMELAR